MRAGPTVDHGGSPGRIAPSGHECSRRAHREGHRHLPVAESWAPSMAACCCSEVSTGQSGVVGKLAMASSTARFAAAWPESVRRWFIRGSRSSHVLWRSCAGEMADGTDTDRELCGGTSSPGVVGMPVGDEGCEGAEEVGVGTVWRSQPASSSTAASTGSHSVTLRIRALCGTPMSTAYPATGTRIVRRGRGGRNRTGTARP